ncbi:MAG: DUF3427 domain-containing protein, partial [Lentisphaeria bacterium]|nr:DUF3427 domain-containing protein [Lentisphaeria bacterium]
QYFIGLQKFTPKCPFTAPALVSFRKRLTADALVKFNEICLRGLPSTLHFGLWTRNSEIPSLPESIARLKANGPFYDELLALVDYLYENTDLVTVKPVLPFACPLELHANYTAEEILTALGKCSMSNPPYNLQSGVLNLPEINTDMFLVTLNKSEKQYSPTTMYLDYAISDELFHWQSQNATSVWNRQPGSVISTEQVQSCSLYAKTRTVMASVPVIASSVRRIMFHTTVPARSTWNGNCVIKCPPVSAE